MRTALAAVAMLAWTGLVNAQPVSAYTPFDLGAACMTVAASAQGEGDFADIVCPGYKGLPVLVTYTDLRYAIVYGFPPEGDFPRVPGFHPFNHPGPTIEWRLSRDGDVERPYAAIQRWFVAAGGEGEADTELLVVSRVADLETRTGCIAGYVLASGNARANEEARAIADDTVPSFDCAADEPIFADPAIRDLVSG